ncbi:hypothetical protein B4U79_02596 [Dinothrombium tinctorium]|uniref:Uncharacterized protein n=1 Tax=Dinothrombium tinctorium TaxID=1965070 RepID=A0A443QYP4_9ACAR|nr:hypothetical protein B4U79_02596 [Dinothrombium tinctorium]
MNTMRIAWIRKFAYCTKQRGKLYSTQVFK